MIPSLIYRRSAPMYWRLQPTRFFLPAAVLIALNPISSLAFVAPDGCRRSFQLAPSSLAPNNEHPPAQYLPLRSYLRSSILSLSLSTSENTHGSSAVRSMKPLPKDDVEELQFQLLSFYRFIPISQPDNVRDTLFERLKTIIGLRGTVYVAKEGINAQFAVPVGEPLKELLEAFGKENAEDDGSAGGCLPFDTFEKNVPNMGNVVGSDTPTFDRLIVRTRNYILRDNMNLNGEDEDSTLDWSDTGMELNPSEWDEQLRRPNIQLLDCRNAYESDQGSFVSAKPLNTQTFSDTWSILDSQVESQSLDPSEPVYIFCTGGIRCVKVGAYLRQRLGFDDVRTLKHGIIGFERWKDDNDGSIAGSANDSSFGNDANNQQGERGSLWIGENFLFDKRRFTKEDNDSDNKTSDS